MRKAYYKLSDKWFVKKKANRDHSDENVKVLTVGQLDGLLNEQTGDTDEEVQTVHGDELAARGRLPV